MDSALKHYSNIFFFYFQPMRSHFSTREVIHLGVVQCYIVWAHSRENKEQTYSCFSDSYRKKKTTVLLLCLIHFSSSLSTLWFRLIIIYTINPFYKSHSSFLVPKSGYYLVAVINVMIDGQSAATTLNVWLNSPVVPDPPRKANQKTQKDCLQMLPTTVSKIQ